MSDQYLDPPAHEHHVRGWAVAHAEPFALAAPSTVELVNGAGLWVGYAMEETSGAAAARLVIGDGSQGAIMLPFGPYTFLASESRDEMFPGRGLLFTRGLTVTSTAGAVAGSLWVAMLSREHLAGLIATMRGNDR